MEILNKRHTLTKTILGGSLVFELGFWCPRRLAQTPSPTSLVTLDMPFHPSVLPSCHLKMMGKWEMIMRTTCPTG